MFFVRGRCGGCITRFHTEQISIPRVEVGSNTFTVTLRVVGGDEKGSLKSETVKYGRESRTRESLSWQGPAAYTKDRLVLLSERAPHKKKDRKCQIVYLTDRQSQCDFDFDRFQRLSVFKCSSV
jgi:hypothetical protein